MVKLRDNNGQGDKPGKAERLASLDAVRGAFQLLLVSGGFGLKEMLPDERWNWLTHQFASSDWQGCTLWDLLCPAFLLIAGIALPYSIANRQGQSWFRQLAHALLRAGVLIVLGIYLDSYHARPSPHLVFDLRGTLQQVGLAYLIAFLVLPLGMPVQGLAAAFLLVGHTAAHVIYAFGSGQEFFASAQANVGVAIDHWLGFTPHPERYVTLNVASATAIVLLGTLVGGLVRSALTPGAKVAILTACSFAAIISAWGLSGGGVLADWTPLIPLIRRLGTLTFVLAAAGGTILVFTYFYLFMDGLLVSAWALPLSLVGQNSLLLYLAYRLSRHWAETTANLLVPAALPGAPGLRPLILAAIVTAIYWLFCWWLYRRRIFFKV